jgi:HlyD family secretion protein
VSQIRLEPTVSANVVTYTTIISAPNDNLKLKPGMTANITVFTKEDSNALLIPSKALKFQPTEALAKQYRLGARMVDSAASRKKTRVSDSATRKMSDTTGSVKKTRAFVWIKKQDSLVQRRVVIGLNDDANAQVLYGLTLEDEVAIGIENQNSDKTAPTKEVSPFMPTRRNNAPPKPPPSSK